MASVDIILFTSKTLKNNEHPIMFRVIKDRKVKYSSLGHSCLAEHWDHKKNTPKRKHPNFKELELFIDHKRNEAKKLLLDAERNNIDLSVEEIITKITRKKVSKSVFNFLDDLISDMRNAGRIGNSKVYIDLKRVLTSAYPGKEIFFNELTPSFLRKLEQYFNERSFNPNTQGVYFRTLRSTVNKAIMEDLLNAESNPFKKYSISHLKNETEKKAITQAEIKKIEALEVSNDKYLQLAQDFFMFSYYCSGINFIDFAQLKWLNISIRNDNYHLHYVRSKTKKGISVQLNYQAKAILFKYGDISLKDVYIFPVLDAKRHHTPVSISNRVQKISTQINRSLKTLAKMAQVDANITAYTARHTFATVLKRNGTPTAYISEMMGHKSESITQVYLDSFENDKLFEASKSL